MALVEYGRGYGDSLGVTDSKLDWLDSAIWPLDVNLCLG